MGLFGVGVLVLGLRLGCLRAIVVGEKSSALMGPRVRLGR